MKATLGAVIWIGIVAAAGPLLAEEVYFNDFETGTCPDWPEWTNCKPTESPNGTQQFLGEYGLGNSLTTLTLTDLPAHTEITLSFDLYIICTWDGNQDDDTWELRADGTSLMHVSFANPESKTQSYPAPFEEADNPPGTGAYVINTLGYSCAHPPIDDATYRFPNSDWSFTIPHTDSTITIEFEGYTNQLPDDESWGLDNVSVEVNCEDPGSGLIAYYPFDGDALDRSASGNDGTEFGDVAYAPSGCGMAVVFDGVDDHIELCEPLLLNGTDFTIAFWMQTTDTGTYIIHSYAPADPEQDWSQQESLIIGTESSGTDTLIYQSGWGMHLINDAAVVDGDWHHLVFTHDDDNGDYGSYSAYLDGVFQASDTPGWGETVPTDTWIGESVDEYTSTADFEGMLDELRVYDRILCLEEIVLLASKNPCFADCNANGVPDSDDIANGTSQDCDANTVPDECEGDLDGDGLIDGCDPDIDADDVPNDDDVCPAYVSNGGVDAEGRPLGDLDLDCDVDLDDYSILANNYINGPDCLNGDANKDGAINPLDSGYVLARFGTCPDECPE
ncbi:MAG: LamG domain-containing protein [Planctomycetes bacterium]|nr:LamG domain-containing protein [Planctomycetota bacterium]